MNALTNVALSTLPVLVRLVGADKTSTLAIQAADVVASVTGTRSEAQACELLLDPKLAGTLRLQLAELALEAQIAQTATETAQRQLQAEQIKSLVSQLSVMLAHLHDVPPPRAPAPSPAPSSNFLPCLHEVLDLEGGYSDDPRDPGGPTNFGISRPEWAAVCRVPLSSITPENMRALTLRQAASVYRKFYWNAMCCEDFKRGVDLMVFQFGVNAGVDASAKVLQGVCGVTADGVIGPITLRAANQREPVALIHALAQAQLARYRTFAEWDLFGDGWTNRVDNAEQVALGMTRPVISLP